MKYLKIMALAALVGVSGAAHANGQMLETATKNGCFICHSVQAKTGPAIPLAPAYADIAERFKDQKDAASYLSQRILQGTVNTKQDWEGKVNMRFMPPNVSVSAEEATKLAEWILSIKKDAISEEVITHEGMLTLAAQNGCIACHGVSQQTDSHYIPLAPAFHAVAERYKGNADAKKTLVESIISGTVDKEKKWPDVNMRFMPPNPSLSPKDAETLVDWILSQ
ncbi:c-type cytochrome [Thiothrix fructosivorans]|uniref:C-type cytochrome n=1 Tax=Thiothrix fructosivorans TaxID=111770 RepID=A0A8B0SR24_9GAMM|nr:c-type cytochrome [Thiothrix fructosivorans]MBO0612369.1 c-type cytochrome [Thiothrix fructosivorans]QTX12147.1 c-type cytochrome [Thiothrix fructosivorans]